MPKEKASTRKSAKSSAKADGGKKKKGQSVPILLSLACLPYH